MLGLCVGSTKGLISSLVRFDSFFLSHYHCSHCPVVASEAHLSKYYRQRIKEYALSCLMSYIIYFMD